MTTRLQISRDRAVAHAEESLWRFCATVRAVDDPEAAAIGTWSARDVAAHVTGGFPMFLNMLRGQGSTITSIDGIADFNATVVSKETRSCRELAGALEGLIPDFLAAATAAGPEPLAWHGGITLPVETFCAIMIGETQVHGYDVARAQGERFDIDPAAVRTAFIGLLPLTPRYVDEVAAGGTRARFEVKLRGEDGASAVLFFDDGALTIEDAPEGPVDCRVSADPVSFMLVSYGRMGPVVPALTGKMVAWGRKPWLGLRLPRLLRSP